ncbi:hypothetical protein ASF70_12800 [Rhizobium sp. Leaf321]|uniref:hypothetical protein n=1 Tax=Rhizobium sp. Leaf321 TaxID=1736335 RepID=UPI0007151BA8|nr:hypothetical protein [Rhizobium sp. Leaf321]KQQ72406.1 hypothetical protein ASF70_12800 [Rhizobium sp. Leaf321]
MIDHPEITLCEPAPFLYYENGQIAVTDGSQVWLVIVTCEAIRAVASPPEMSLRRLALYAEFFTDLAAAAISRGENIGGKVLISESDVLSTKVTQRHVPQRLQRPPGY